MGVRGCGAEVRSTGRALALSRKEMRMLGRIGGVESVVIEEWVSEELDGDDDSVEDDNMDDEDEEIILSTSPTMPFHIPCSTSCSTTLDEMTYAGTEIDEDA
jgi:hypothetical protein